MVANKQRADILLKQMLAQLDGNTSTLEIVKKKVQDV